jgi:hypothetical protein
VTMFVYRVVDTDVAGYGVSGCLLNWCVYVVSQFWLGILTLAKFINCQTLPRNIENAS